MQNFILHGLVAAFIEYDFDLVGGAADPADDKLFSLNQAVWNEMIRSNPAQLTTRPRKTRKEITTLSDEQIQKFGALVEQDNYRAILKFILFSGVRESEAIGLTWDCIDFDRGTIRIYRQMLKRTKEAGGYTLASLKNDKERLLTPPPMLLSMLKKWSSV